MRKHLKEKRIYLRAKDKRKNSELRRKVTVVFGASVVIAVIGYIIEIFGIFYIGVAGVFITLSLWSFSRFVLPRLTNR